MESNNLIDCRMVDTNVIQNDFLTNIELSVQARFAGILIFCYPKKKHFNVENLSEQMNLNKNTAGKYLNELIKAGYLIRRVTRKGGNFSTVKYYYSDSKEDIQNLKNHFEM